MGRGNSNIITNATARLRCRRLIVAKAGLQNARESSHQRTWGAITSLSLRNPCSNPKFFRKGSLEMMLLIEN